MSLNIRYANKGEVIDKEWATRSYYSRHELQARASRGIGKLWIVNYEFWIGRRVGRMRQVRQMGQMGRGENFEFWIGYELQACASGGEERHALIIVGTSYKLAPAGGVYMETIIFLQKIGNHIPWKQEPITYWVFGLMEIVEK